MSLKIAIVYGSVRRDRLGIRVVRFLKSELEKRGQEVDVIDALEEALPLLDLRLSDYITDPAPDNLDNLAARIKAAEAFIIVSGEYNHTLQPGLINLIDHFYGEWGHRAVGFATYSTGGFGGVRAGAHIRSISSAVGMLGVPASYTQPNLEQAIDADGKALSDSPAKFAATMLDQLIWYAAAIKAKREAEGLPGRK